MSDSVTHDRLRRLRRTEEAWGPKLKRASLVAELELTNEELRPALRDLMQLWNEDGPSYARRRIRISFPATFVTAVAGMGSIRYDIAGFYTAIFSAAEVGYTQDLARQWATLFLECLEKLGLPTFPQLDREGAHRFVSRMLLHGGVPLDHLDELFDVIAQAIRATDSTDPAALHAWLVEQFEARRLYRATVAVGRFLQYGGQYAVDFLDRSLELLERVQANEDTDEIRVGLPRRYVERAIELRRRGELPDQPRRTATTSATASIRRRPEVHFDPYGVGPHLLMPEAVDDHDAGRWTVTMGDRVERVTIAAGARGAISEAVAVPLAPHSPQVEVQNPAGVGAVIRLFDPDDPLLLFTSGGRMIERVARVPTGLMWAIHPSDRELVTTGGAQREVHEVVPRWAGWRAVQLDMSTAGVLGLHGGRDHYVEERRTASVVNWQPVDHVEAVDGPTLLCQFPDLVLPGAAGSTTWEITLSGTDGSDERVLHRNVGGDDVGISLRDVLDPLALAALRLRARGPLGSSLRRDFRVVPGMRLECSPPVRRLGPDGLSPARIDVAGLDVPVLTLGPRERRTRIHQPQIGTFTVTPPAVGVLHARSGSGATWRTSPLVLDVDKLADDPGHLLVRIPDERGDVQLQLLVQGTQVLQIDPVGAARTDGTRTFDLRRALDGLRHHGSGVLAVRSSAWSGRVGVVKPSQVVEEVYAVGGGTVLQFVGVAAGAVEAAVWSRLAPLTPPWRTDLVADGRHAIWQLPDELIGFGPLRVLVRINDPWLSEPLPAFPPRGPNVFDIDLPWAGERLDAADGHVSYLAGEIDDIDAADDLGAAVKLFSIAYLIEAPRGGDDVRRDLAPQLREHPDEVLAVALDEQLTGADLARLLVESGLVTTRATPTFGTVDAIERLLGRWVGAAAVALPRDVSGDGAADIRELLLRDAGEDVTPLLEGDWAEPLALPEIDRDMARRIDQPVETLRAIERAVGLVPKTAFDADTQATAAFHLLLALKDGRNASAYGPLVADADGIIRDIRHNIIGRLSLDELGEGVRRRIQGEGWQNLPAVSLALASLARVQARTSRPVFRSFHRKAMSRLTRLAPAIVGTDLLLAELAIQGALRAR